jgi:hypothetical protein
MTGPHPARPHTVVQTDRRPLPQNQPPAARCLGKADKCLVIDGCRGPALEPREPQGRWATTHPERARNNNVSVLENAGNEPLPPSLIRKAVR